ncbi:MAG: M16 family metallopeptidase, partial [Alphaproteobacteria bacterium]
MTTVGQKLAAIGVAAALGLGAASAAAQSIHERVSEFTLDNGLQVVVVPDNRAPVVTHMIWYRIGAVDETPGKSGVAHFLEHLMFKGTRTFPDGGFSDRVSDIGGNDNAFTTSDATGYHQTVARQHLGLMMEFEADRMRNLVLTEDDVTTEREVILEERRSRVDNEPSAQLREAINAALYQNSRYGVPVIGWEHEVSALTRQDALGVYDRFYSPNNAILVVAGDVEEAEVRALAEATYGRVPARADVPERVTLSEPPPLSPRLVTLSDERVRQPTMSRYYLTPSYVTAEPGEAEALDLLADILGSGTTSRFYRNLVVDSGKAVAAGAGYRGGQRGDGAFVLWGIPRGGRTLEDVAGDIDAELDVLLRDSVTAAELQRAQRRIRASTIYAEDDSSHIGRTYSHELVIGRTIDDVRQWLARIEAVTIEDIDAAAQKSLDPR